MNPDGLQKPVVENLHLRDRFTAVFDVKSNEYEIKD